MLNRRSLIKGTLFSGTALLAELRLGLGRLERAQVQGTDQFAGGKQVGIVDFLKEGLVPLDSAEGVELDGRLYTDLSAIEHSGEVIPADKFYIRTRASALLPPVENWQVKVGGLVEKPQVLAATDLQKNAEPMGVHVMECAGNVRLTRFALISVGSWTGVPVTQILEKAKAKPMGKRVLISGFDRYSTESRTSVPGASWIFTPEQLKAAGAFLATELNGQPLTEDHGAPVRLVVPGWYGCACIKWVDEISLVNDEIEATSQMKEYAARTMQKGVPQRARDFRPALMEQAAMPIRVEKWNLGGKVKYRLVGIMWGGTQSVKKLQIRFNPEEDYVPVHDFQQDKNDPWTVWTHAWSPRAPGTYMIRLAVQEPAVQSRRLDSGYYVRSVEITDV